MSKAEHPLIRASEAFTKALMDAESDPLVNLNLGYHDIQIGLAWARLLTKTMAIPLLASYTEQHINNKGGK